jgi:hypothetical protein
MNVLKINNGNDIPENYTGNTEFPNGDKYWYLNGLWHREDGPAIEWSNGGKEWWVNGMLHRLDGPAIESLNGSKHWYLNNKRHRVDGPAVEFSNGNKKWYLNGVEYPQEEWFEQLSEEDKLNAIWNLDLITGY